MARMREKAAKAEKEAERQQAEDEKMSKRSMATIHTGEEVKIHGKGTL